MDLITYPQVDYRAAPAPLAARCVPFENYVFDVYKGHETNSRRRGEVAEAPAPIDDLAPPALPSSAHRPGALTDHTHVALNPVHGVSVVLRLLTFF
ncbi:jg9680 [Pararge aegeria aegeria]|uniref:Jg9680 protein n=1 Tax=Pararge aegeria aegeria TaxID=348720 RepID=A0A8S4RUS4_9NEOP|nr:jg9680 [Pararge aegeria aegeria]